MVYSNILCDLVTGPITAYSKARKMFLLSLWQNELIINIFTLGRKLGNINTFRFTIHLNNCVVTVSSLFNKTCVCSTTMDWSFLEHIKSWYIRRSKFFFFFFESNFPTLLQRPWSKISTDQIIHQFYLDMPGIQLKITRYVKNRKYNPP